MKNTELLLVRARGSTTNKITFYFSRIDFFTLTLHLTSVIFVYLLILYILYRVIHLLKQILTYSLRFYCRELPDTEHLQVRLSEAQSSLTQSPEGRLHCNSSGISGINGQRQLFTVKCSVYSCAACTVVATRIEGSTRWNLPMTSHKSSITVVKFARRITCIENTQRRNSQISSRWKEDSFPDFRERSSLFPGP